MRPRRAITLALAFAVWVVPGAVSQPANAEQATELHIATLAPSSSTWMKVFDAWNLTLKKETNDTLSLRFHAGGSEGDERDYLRKIRAGELDGAALTSTGLGQIVRPALVLSLPGVFTEYKELDAVRAVADERFAGMFDQEGYTVIGWGDVGKTRLFSKHPIERPSDIQQRRPWVWRDDPVFDELMKVLGATASKLALPKVYPALQSGTIDTVWASALAARSLQWSNELAFVSARSSGIVVGATILRKDKYEALTAKQKQALAKTGSRAHRLLNRSVRRDDDKAYRTILSRGVTAIETDEHESEWAAVEKEVRDRLAGTLYPQSLLDDLMAAAGKQE